MKTNSSILQQNVTLVFDGPLSRPNTKTLLGHKKPETRPERKRRREVIAANLWTPPGGNRRMSDRSHVHGARREVGEETNIRLPLNEFREAGMLYAHKSDGNGGFRLSRIVRLYKVRIDPSAHDIRPNGEYDRMDWFELYQVPFKAMMDSDKVWLPVLLRQGKVTADVYFLDDGTIKCTVR